MFLLDKVLLSPIYAAVWAARQVHAAVRQEQEAAPAQITAELSELYMMLESGRLTEAQFDAREKALLDQLDRLQEEEKNNREEEARTASTRSAAPLASRARRWSPPARGKTQPVEEGRARAAPLASPLASEIGETEAPGPIAGQKSVELKVAAMVVVAMLIGLPEAIAEGSSNLAHRPSEQRLAALAMIETGCSSEQTCRADRSVGPSGEVSRYQILPALWREHHRPRAGGRRPARSPFHNPVVAKAVAERIMDARVAGFVRATGRAPSDFEWYMLWHRPGAFAQRGYLAHRLSPAIKDRAQRFSNLVLSLGRLAAASGP
jgi:hypothetical protein